MAKNKAKLTPCPKCDNEIGIAHHPEIYRSFKMALFICPECEHQWCKDQSVKLQGSLVEWASIAMLIHSGYSGLGDFVRDAVRRRAEEIYQNDYSLAIKEGRVKVN